MTATVDETATYVEMPVEGEPAALEIGTIKVAVTESWWPAEPGFPECREVIVDDGGAPVTMSFADAAGLPAQIREFADKVERLVANAGHLGVR